MPSWLTEAHLDAIPTLQARESILLANVVAVGTGSLKKSESQRITRQWERLARGKRQRARKDIPFQEVARMHGIGVIEEGKSG